MRLSARSEGTVRPSSMRTPDLCSCISRYTKRRRPVSGVLNSARRRYGPAGHPSWGLDRLKKQRNQRVWLSKTRQPYAPDGESRSIGLSRMPSGTIAEALAGLSAKPDPAATRIHTPQSSSCPLTDVPLPWKWDIPVHGTNVVLAISPGSPGRVRANPLGFVCNVLKQHFCIH